MAPLRLLRGQLMRGAVWYAHCHPSRSAVTEVEFLCREPDPSVDWERDPDSLVYRTGLGSCEYPGWAVRLLKERVATGGGVWVDPRETGVHAGEVEDLFERMGWHPDRVVVYAVLRMGGTRYHVVLGVFERG